MSGQVPGKSKVQNFIYRLLNRWMPESWLTWLGNCFAPEPIYPLCVDLTAIEKAKMDYEHRLKVKEMRWDKGIFAILVALVGVFAYYRANKYLDDHRASIADAAEKERVEVAKSLEKNKQEESRKLEEFRTKEAEHRLLLEKQLPEMLQINSAISDVTSVYFKRLFGKKTHEIRPLY